MKPQDQAIQPQQLKQIFLHFPASGVTRQIFVAPNDTAGTVLAKTGLAAPGKLDLFDQDGRVVDTGDSSFHSNLPVGTVLRVSPEAEVGG